MVRRVQREFGMEGEESDEERQEKELSFAEKGGHFGTLWYEESFKS